MLANCFVFHYISIWPLLAKRTKFSRTIRTVHHLLYIIHFKYKCTSHHVGLLNVCMHTTCRIISLWTHISQYADVSNQPNNQPTISSCIFYKVKKKKISKTKYMTMKLNKNIYNNICNLISVLVFKKFATCLPSSSSCSTMWSCRCCCRCHCHCIKQQV